MNKNKTNDITIKTSTTTDDIIILPKIDFAFKEIMTNELLAEGIYCNPNTAFEEFMLTKEIYDKFNVR